MKIMKVDFPENFDNKGLKPIKMDKLGDVVVIAGKNGAGKTRLLSLINKIGEYSLNKKGLEKEQNTAISWRRNVQNDPTNPNRASWEEVATKSEKKLQFYKCVQLDDEISRGVTIKFVPNKLNLTDCNDISVNAKISNHDALKFDHLNEQALSYIQMESEMYWRVTHPLFDAKAEDKTRIISSYDNLNDLIKNFLGTKLWSDTKGNCTIFDLRLGEANLSDGQKVLLQLCVAIHALGASLDNLILILDEPENHLHPAAQIEFIKKVNEVLKHGQIWIATHSIHILSHLDTSDIWYMSDGGIKYAGKEPEIVLQGLLGEEEQVQKLRDFIDLPAQFAVNQFAYECLFAPEAVETTKEDKQTTQIRDFINKRKSENGRVKILDYGAGKGRLLSAISENENETDKIKNWLDYVAFDSNPGDKGDCIKVLDRVYKDSNKRYFNDIGELRDNHCEKVFDVVILCNVLHEISPNRWINLFTKDLENKIIKENGHLLIVEDLHIPSGEKPNSDGFFILSVNEVRTIFRIAPDAKDFEYESCHKSGRLMRYTIPQKYLSNVTKDSRKEALEKLGERCEEKIRNLRKESDYKNGRKLALYTQQLANVVLMLKDLGS